MATQYGAGTPAEILALYGHGFSQHAISRLAGRAQSGINDILKQRGLTASYRHTVNRAQRDGMVEVLAVEVWEPYRIVHPRIARMFNETHVPKPPSEWRIGRVNF